MKWKHFCTITLYTRSIKQHPWCNQSTNPMNILYSKEYKPYTLDVTSNTVLHTSSPCHHQIQYTFFHLIHCRIHNKSTIRDQAHSHSCYCFFHGYLWNSHSSPRRGDGQRFRTVFKIIGEHPLEHLGRMRPSICNDRSQGPIDQARDQYLVVFGARIPFKKWATASLVSW